MNLSVRMMGRRYTRLTKRFQAKKLDMHVASTALTIVAYNFVRQLQDAPVLACDGREASQSTLVEH